MRGLFERFEEGVEGGGGEHVYLIDDVHLVLTQGGSYVYLVDEGANVVHGVIGGGIELHYIVGALTIGGYTAFALVAGFALGGTVLAVNGFSKNACAGSFAHATRTAKR